MSDVSFIYKQTMTHCYTPVHFFLSSHVLADLLLQILNEKSNVWCLLDTQTTPWNQQCITWPIYFPHLEETRRWWRGYLTSSWRIRRGRTWRTARRGSPPTSSCPATKREFLATNPHTSMAQLMARKVRNYIGFLLIVASWMFIIITGILRVGCDSGDLWWLMT